jgi:hypothetical protein
VGAVTRHLAPRAAEHLVRLCLLGATLVAASVELAVFRLLGLPMAPFMVWLFFVVLTFFCLPSTVTARILRSPIRWGAVHAAVSSAAYLALCA